MQLSSQHRLCQLARGSHPGPELCQPCGSLIRRASKIIRDLEIIRCLLDQVHPWRRLGVAEVEAAPVIEDAEAFVTPKPQTKLLVPCTLRPKLR